MIKTICIILLLASVCSTAFAAETIEVINGEVVKTENFQTVRKIDAEERLRNIDYELNMLQAEIIKLEIERDIILVAGISLKQK